MGGDMMSEKYNVAKLIYISDEQKQDLLEIKEEVAAANGDTSLNQLIRDAIDILTCFYKDEIVQYRTPNCIKNLAKN